jgi:cytochrome c553/uncharacterized membrane protein YedE/YeeE
VSDLPVATVMALGGFGLGLAFGWTAQRTHFCTMGAISDLMVMGDGRRMRAWMLAAAVAIIGTQALEGLGLVAVDKSVWRAGNPGWAGAILGGLMFGYGMTLAGGCGNKTLVRLGAGNLKSLVVALVMALFAYMTQRGLTAPVRVWLDGLSPDMNAYHLQGQGLAAILAHALGLDVGAARLGLVALVGGGLAVWCLKDRAFRASRHDMVAGLVIGLLVVAGWLVTGRLGADPFEPAPVTSISFVSPLGASLQYLMSFTGSDLDFGISLVGGVVAGSFLAARLGGRFALEGFTETPDMVRHLWGAALMGMGGVLAMGCTIGQGITGLATLSATAPLALMAILAGCALGLKRLEAGSWRGLLGALCLLAALPAQAQDMPLLAETCSACHGTDGHGSGAIPAIAGKPVAELRTALMEFNDGRREATVMDRIARGLSAPQIEELARVFGR